MKIQIVNEKDEIIGTKERSEIDYTTDIYRVSALWITNSLGQALLAKRAATKDKDPSKWGPAVAGTIEEGETYDSNIYKEAEEEIGLTGVEFTKTRKLYTDHPRKAFTQWYTGTVDRKIDDFIRQVEEVDELAWVDTSQIEQDLQSNPDKYIPAMPSVLSRLGLLSKESKTHPVLKTTFEYRGETINCDWYEITDISELPDIEWEQVYAVGNVNGEVPVVHYADSEVRNLPGGRFDEPGDTIERVLHREMEEELNMRVLSWRPIGYQFLSNQKFGNAYQLRVYAELEPIGEFVSDPGGSVVGHSLVPVEELNSYVQYGDVGERMINLVKKEFGK